MWSVPSFAPHTGKRARRVALEQGHAKDLEEAAVRKHELVLRKQLLLIRHHPRPVRHPDSRLDLREDPAKGRRHLGRREIPSLDLPASVEPVLHNGPDDPRAPDLEVVIAQLMPDKQRDQQTAREANRQAKNIYGRGRAVLPEIAEGGKKPVFDHRRTI